MMTAYRLYEVLLGHPYPGVAGLCRDGDDCLFVLDGAAWRYDGAGWTVRERGIRATWPALDSPDDGDRVHAEIRRVLAIVNADRLLIWEQTKGTYWVGPDLPTIPTPEDLAAEPSMEDALHDRLTDEIDRRRDVEQALAKVTSEHDALQDRLDGLKRDRHEETLRWADEREALRAEVKRLTDAHAVVSQRLIGSQKEVAEVSAERDEATARADKMTAQTKEMRISFAEFERRGEQIERDDELREQIAVAVGLDGSASLALILDTVRRDAPDDPRAVKGLRALLDYTHAPIRFGDRQLSDAERAAFVIRRLDTRVSEVVTAEVFLDCAGVPAYALAPGDDPDAPSERLSLSERLRLHFAARKDP